MLAKTKGAAEAIKTELTYRGVDLAGLNTFTEFKKALKTNEEARVAGLDMGDDEKKKASAMAKKAFTVFSAANFHPST